MNNQNQQLNKEPAPEQTPEQPITPQESAKKPKAKWLVPVIVVVGVVVLGLIVWGTYELFKPAPLEDEFKDWKTYRNEEYGYEVRYPEDWEITEENNLVYWIDDIRTGHRTLDIYIEDRQDKGLTEWITERGYKKIKDLKIDDIDGAIIDFSFVEESGAYIAAIFPKKDKMFRIGLTSDSVEKLNQILSTFKFIEPDESANWKTYRNEEYGFEVRYPEKYFLNDRSTNESVIFDTEGVGTGLLIEIIEKSFVERMDQLGDEGWQGKGTKGFNNIVWSIRYREGTDLVPGEWHKSIRQYDHEDKVIEITLNRSTEDLFNQILSTFKFLD